MIDDVTGKVRRMTAKGEGGSKEKEVAKMVKVEEIEEEEEKVEAQER